MMAGYDAEMSRDLGWTGRSAHCCCIWEGEGSNATFAEVLPRSALGSADEQDLPAA
jgi:hypothetical protein